MNILRLILCCALLLFVSNSFAQQTPSKGKSAKQPKVVVEEPIVEEEIIFVKVEVEPQFPGGTKEEFANWVSRQILYPAVASENGIQGKVTVSFTVGADGQVKDVKIERGVDPSLDKEAIRVVKKSPRWIPAKQNGLAVSYLMRVAVNFTLK